MGNPFSNVTQATENAVNISGNGMPIINILTIVGVVLIAAFVTFLIIRNVKKNK